MKKILCLAAALMLIALAVPEAGTAHAGGIPDRVVYDILTVEQPVGDTDMLVTYDDNGNKRYGIFHQDDSITPLAVDELAMRRQYFPDRMNEEVPYEFGILPNGDYYEQMEDNFLSEGCIRILNQEGEVLYASGSAQAGEKILGSYGDKIVAIQRDGGDWNLFVMDHSGELLGAMCDVSPYGRCICRWGLTDLGYGLFGLRNADDEVISSFGDTSLFFDINRISVFTTPVWHEIRPFSEETGDALWEKNVNSRDRSWEYWRITPGMLTDEETLENAVAGECPFRADIRSGTIGDGLVCDYDYRMFMDYSGGEVFSLSDIGYSMTTVGAGRFRNGGAPVVLKSADGYYATMLDRDGKAQYTPVRLRDHDDFWGFVQSDMLDHSVNGIDVLVDQGYISYAAYLSGYDRYLITPQGEDILLPENLALCLGFVNGYIVYSTSLIRASEPGRVIKKGYIPIPAYEGPDYSDAWVYTWKYVDDPESLLVVSRNGDGTLHMKATLYMFDYIPIEADFIPDDFESISFSRADGSLGVHMVIDPNDDTRLYVEMSVPEQNEYHGYFEQKQFVFIRDEVQESVGFDEPQDPDFEDDWYEPRPVSVEEAAELFEMLDGKVLIASDGSSRYCYGSLLIDSQGQMFGLYDYQGIEDDVISECAWSGSFRMDSTLKRSDGAYLIMVWDIYPELPAGVEFETEDGMQMISIDPLFGSEEYLVLTIPGTPADVIPEFVKNEIGINYPGQDCSGFITLTREYDGWGYYEEK